MSSTVPKITFIIYPIDDNIVWYMAQWSTHVRAIIDPHVKHFIYTNFVDSTITNIINTWLYNFLQIEKVKNCPII